MLRILKISLLAFMSVFLIGCSISTTMPVSTLVPATQTSLPIVTETEPALISTVTATAAEIESEPIVTSSPNEALDRAVANLINAASFKMSVHDIRAYQIIERSGETRMVYGEFNADYAVIRLLTVKAHGSHQYRYDPQGEFQKFDTYTYQENGKYFIRNVEPSGADSIEEIDPEQIEPLAGDVYQTLVNYSDQAKFLSESDGTAVYVIEHPEWYTLNRAIGFADLGFLHMQENGEQLIEQYVADHYLNVTSILFTVYMSVDEHLITKVEVNDSDFMASIWVEIERALIEGGAEPENQTHYEVMDVNGAVFFFGNYNQVQDFEIPQ